MIARITAGISVQVTSRVVFPWVCLGSGPCPVLDEYVDQSSLDHHEYYRSEHEEQVGQLLLGPPHL
jgi:hypothetical protein